MKLICIIKGDEWRGNLQYPLVPLLKHKLKRESGTRNLLRSCEPDEGSAETRPLYLFVAHNIDGFRRTRSCTEACKSNQSSTEVQHTIFQTHTNTHHVKETLHHFSSSIFTRTSLLIFFSLYPPIHLSSHLIPKPPVSSYLLEFHYSLVKHHFKISSFFKFQVKNM